MHPPAPPKYTPVNMDNIYECTESINSTYECTESIYICYAQSTDSDHPILLRKPRIRAFAQ